MSDKETAPWMREAAKEYLRRLRTDPYPRPEEIEYLAGFIAKFAVECTAPAPQPADEIVAGLLLRGIEYCAELADEGTPWESVAEPEPQYFATFLEAYDFQIELAASPQVTPELELEREADGRWLAAFMRFPGVAAYGPTKEEAIWNAAKVLIESAQASATPEKCPKCGSVSFWSSLPPCHGIEQRHSWHSGEVERG